MTRLCPALALLLLMLTGPPRLAHAGDTDHGEVAPDGCWSMEDGCPAHTGAARTAGVGGPLKEAWSVAVGDADQAIMAEPRVWHDRVFVEVGSGGQRALHVLGLGDGRALAKPLTISGDHPLSFGVWEDAVLVQEGSAALALYHLRGGRFQLAWRAEARAAFHAPLLLDGTVVALDGESVVAWASATGTERWRSKGRYRGGSAAADGHVYVLASDDVGNLKLVSLSVNEGLLVSERFIGTYQRKGVPPVGVIAAISVHPNEVFVQHEQKLRSGSRLGARANRVGRMRGFLAPGSGILAYQRLPVAAGVNWLVTEQSEGGGLALRLTFADKEDARATRSFVLADDDLHPDFPRTPVPITVAGAVAYLGGRAFEWDSRQVTWIAADPRVRFRAVPARGALLLVPEAHEGRRLSCLREVGARAAGALFLGAAHTIGTKKTPEAHRQTGSVLFVDESWHAGDYQINPDGSSVATFQKKGKREKTRTYAMTEVSLILDREDRVLYTSSVQSMDRVLRQWQFRRRAPDYYKFVRAAYKTFDAAFMSELIAAAALRGISQKKLAFPRKQHAGLVRRPRKVHAKKRAKIQADIAALKAADAEQMLRVLASPLEDPRWPIQQAFARRALLADPLHTRASALIKARLPDYIPPPVPFFAADWIDFVDQLQHTQVRKIDPPAPGAKGLTLLQREYGSARATWRKDLVALQSEELLIFTPLARPGRIAGCLSMGALVCDALETLFETGENVRSAPLPLILRLYETKKEYLEQASGPGTRESDRKRMEWTGGHYSPSAGLSRIYLPATPDAWPTVMSVYAHELTHHWISERCPLFKPAQKRRAGGLPGYWIVEGMATFVEEFRWNLTERSWDTVNHAAQSLDVVANATPQQLHPWQELYRMPQLRFLHLNRSDAERQVPMRWRLGYKHQVSEAGMFYYQAAATCHYLYHAGAEPRRRLLKYVRAYYTSSVGKELSAFRRIIGMDPDELGAKVVRHARAMNQRR